MKRYLNTGSIVLSVVLFAYHTQILADGWDPSTQASNIGSIANTRHNLTMSYSTAAAIMDAARNDYIEICVYCHTPHGSNSSAKAVGTPLWNRTINQSDYIIFDKPRTLNQPIGQPGPNSLTCLSCHDGTISTDSIINMPGSGRYSKAQETSMDIAFLDQWALDGNAGPQGNHWGLSGNLTGCMVCHNLLPDGTPNPIGPDFTVFQIGTDLTDDHPIGILYPQTFGPGTDFNEPTLNFTTAGGGKMQVFDFNGNSYPDKDEPRAYDTGEGPEVECASCHDPHGVPSGGEADPNSKFSPSFLRVNNGVVDDGTPGTAGIISASGSALCLTCHAK